MSERICDVPKLMAKWAFPENEIHGDSPERLGAKSSKKVWWRCAEKGHLYQRQPSCEVLGRSCPVCREESVTRISDRPDMIEKWAYEENKSIGLLPEKLSVHLKVKAWWKCGKGHLYQRAICKEELGTRKCPICRKEQQETISDHPDILEKWAMDENKALGLTPNMTSIGSSKVVWWKCVTKGHLYQRAVHRESSRPSQCPVCRKENQEYLSDFPEVLKEFAYDLNDVPPESITAGSDVPVFWRCTKEGHVWKTQPYHRLRGNTGCPYCSGKRYIRGYNDIVTVNPPNLKYWDYKKNNENDIFPGDYAISSRKKAWWICDNGHSTYDKIKQVLNRKAACSECIRINKEKSATAAMEKEARKAEMARQREANRAKTEQERKAKEQQAKEQQVLKITDLIRTYWDDTENSKRGFALETVTFKRVYCWKCNKGHQWKRDLQGMLNDSKCPVCNVEEYSISAMYPYLIDFYDIDKNGNIPPEHTIAISSQYYWWTCRNGHSFVATLKSVSSHKETGCMFCDKEKSFYSV